VSNGEHDKQVVGFLGVGLDTQDGHQRITNTEHFLLLGGSAATHEQLQDTAGRFNDALARRGKALPETSMEAIIELFHESQEN